MFKFTKQLNHWYEIVVIGNDNKLNNLTEHVSVVNEQINYYNNPSGKTKAVFSIML